MTNKNYGVYVTLRYKDDRVVYLRNVTEIHYNYPGVLLRHSKRSEGGLVPGSGRIAFESDIHQTGLLVEIEDVKEFETILEIAKAASF